MSIGGGRPVDGAFPSDKSIGGLMDWFLSLLRFAEEESAIMRYEEDEGTLYYHDALYYQKITAELLWKSGCRMMLNTTVVDVLKEENKVIGAVVSCEMRKAAILAEAFVDCTENAFFAEACGAGIKGNVNKIRYAYPYLLQNIDAQKVEEYRGKDAGFQKAVMLAKKNLDLKDTENAFWKFDSGDDLFQIKTDIADGIAYADTIHIEQLRGDGFRTRTEAELLARVKVFEHLNFFRKYIPGMENAKLLQTASGVIQEGNCRIQGTVFFTEEMCRNKAAGQEGIVRFRSGQEGTPDYELPYQVMTIPEMDNLVVAGKAISAEASLVEKLGCGGRMVMGQGAGIMASWMVSKGLKANEIDGISLRSRLEELGCDFDGEKTRSYRPDSTVIGKGGDVNG